MKKIIGTRGIGKSARLIEYAIKNDCIVLTHYPAGLRELARKMGVSDKIEVLPYSAYQIEELEQSNTPYVVDCMDMFLKLLFRNMKGYTLDLEVYDEQ